MITRLGRTALFCYSIIMVAVGCILFFNRAAMVAEYGLMEERKKAEVVRT